MQQARSWGYNGKQKKKKTVLFANNNLLSRYKKENELIEFK